MTSPAHLAANAARSNLTSFRPGDRVYISHQRLAPGRLHQAVVTKVLNANIHFSPPLFGLLKDPEDPEAGAWIPLHPITSISSANCYRSAGEEFGARVEEFERHGQAWKRLVWLNANGAATMREIRCSWLPMDDDVLGDVLVKLKQ